MQNQQINDLKSSVPSGKAIVDTSFRIFSAPGRVNLIGEHTDYNDGFVLPVAIDRRTRVKALQLTNRTVHILSEQFKNDYEFDIDAEARRQGDWGDYVQGVARSLIDRGYTIKGADLTISSNVPVGAGLSSSAALEVSSGFALLTVSGNEIDLLQLALAAQQGESHFVGMRCGNMDQLIACFGQVEHALLIDCRSLDLKNVPIRAKTKIVVANTMVRHELASSEYTTRRAECEEGVSLLRKAGLDVHSLRDVPSASALEQFGDDLPDAVYRRCRHVVTENQRVIDTVTAFESRDLRKAGELMAASHASLRDDYEVSCQELDIMVDIANRAPGLIGARMTGGGFGGCTVNLVAEAECERFCDFVATRYEKETGISPDVYRCESSDGVHEEPNIIIAKS